MQYSTLPVVVVGAAAVDIQGAPDGQALAWKDSNPGTIHLTMGGVGRNIAETLARLRVSTELLAAVGGDSFGDLIRLHAKSVGIGMEHCLLRADARSATFMSVNEVDGDLALAIADMDVVVNITPDYLKKHAALLGNASAIVVETNLSQEAIDHIVAHYAHIPLFVDAVSVIKAEKLKGHLDKFHTIKPNQYEAQYLSGIEIRDGESLNLAVDFFLEQGLKQVFLTLGKHGAYFANHEERGFMPAPKKSPINTLGAGDAFLATCVEGFIAKRPITEITHRAMLASYLTLQDVLTVSPDVTQERLKFLQTEMPPEFGQRVPDL